MSTNRSSDLFLSLYSLSVPDSQMYPAFIFGLLIYIIIMSFNLLVLVAIVVRKTLHKPMFILLFNLPISDMIGATAFFPHLILSIVTKNRLISYPLCITQAFMIHFYGTGNLMILTAMAYDRYIAICNPLKYNIIMNPQKLAIIIFLVWFISFAIIGVLIILLARLQLCRTHIIDLYCNNPSLLKLTCSSTRVNSLFGMAGIVFLQGGSLLVLLYTYTQILYTCLMTNQSNARRKAIQTCGSHLVVFFLLQINTVFTLAAHRVNNTFPYLRRALGVSILIFPPFLDPVIYGLKTKELKQSIQMFFKRNVT